MPRVLVVDDEAIVRESMAAILQLAGFAPSCAENGEDALKKLGSCAPDVILLDLAMPRMDGVAFLGALRADSRFARTPVILLTGAGNRDRILQAIKHGPQDCILKAKFSTKDMIARIRKLVVANGPEKSATAIPEETPSRHPTKGITSSNPSATSAGATGQAEIPRLLTREEALDRVGKAMAEQTLSGVPAQVIAMAASPHSDVASLASLISRDVVLASKILQVANSAAYCSNGIAIVDIPDAVKRLGCSAIRNIASMLGIFEAMPSTSDSDFNFVRCWLHSLAVANLCQLLASQSRDTEAANIAYLVGLCHDLGHILFRSRFGAEYAQVLEVEQRTGKRLVLLERQMLGVTQRDLIAYILRRIGLPDHIREPIEAFHDSSAKPSRHAQLTGILRLADGYANGMMLCASANSDLMPFTRAECKSAVGTEAPSAPPVEQFRNDILAQTMMMARLPRAAERTLTEPLFRPTKTRVWFISEPAFSAFNPIASLVASLASLRLESRLPNPNDADEEFDRLIVLTRCPTTTAVNPAEFKKIASAKPCVWLVCSAENDANRSPDIQYKQLPASISYLARFLEDGGQSAGAKAA